MSNEVYVLVLSSITNKRISFSIEINDYMPEITLDSEKKALEAGYKITPDQEQDNALFTFIFKEIKKAGYWSEWMQDWTSATIYLLYKGTVETNIN